MTRSAPISSPGAGSGGQVAAVTLSINETESLCMKAARGAGFSWGMAEEAGFATGWLARRGIDATAELLALLASGTGHPLGGATLQPLAGRWNSPDGKAVCPIALGAALTDRAFLADGPFGCDTRPDPVAAPILLLPFLVRLAQIGARPLVIDWSSGHLRIDPNGRFDRIAAIGWKDRTALAFTLRAAAATPSCVWQDTPRALMATSPVILAGLTRLMMKTTVPATEVSRRGAGSASTDND